MNVLQVCAYTTIAMLAFAANSLLCRMALIDGEIGPTEFTALRLLSGAIVLSLMVKLSQPAQSGEGSWPSALALFVYASGFSFAYVSMDTGMGALILFGTVQITMMLWNYIKGAQLSVWQWGGVALAAIGLVVLLLPGAQAPNLLPVLLMVLAGGGWAVYSIRGKTSGQPLRATASNFMLACVPTTVLVVVSYSGAYSARGVVLALISGGITSGLGYAVWYKVIPHLRGEVASIVQLSVPVIAVFMGAVWLDELISARILFSCMAVLVGVSLVVLLKKAP